ncbi:MAG: class II fructose-bisphosphate aldolase [bacterium]
MGERIKILNYDETLKVLRSVCPFGESGRAKSRGERWGLLSVNSYGDEWVDAVLSNSAKHRAPIAIVSSPGGFKGWGAGDVVAGMMAGASRLRIFRERPGSLDGQSFEGARVIFGGDHQDAPKYWLDEGKTQKNPDYEKECERVLALAEEAMKIPEVSIYMFDGAHLPTLEENIEMTRHLVEMGKRYGVAVEGELTATAGVEDGKEHTVQSLEGEAIERYVDRICEFIEATGVAAIAFDIGSGHGRREGENIIRTDIVEAYNKEAFRRGVWVPFVLHGGTGVPDETVAEWIGYLGKINKATAGKNVVARGRLYRCCQYIREIMGEPDVGDKAIYNATNPASFYLAGAVPLAKKIEEFVKITNSSGKIDALGL